MRAPRIANGPGPTALTRIPIFHWDQELFGHMDIAAEEHFNGASNKDPDRTSRTVADGVNQILGHGDGFGRAGKADLRLLHQGHGATELLSLLHTLDINCGVT